MKTMRYILSLIAILSVLSLSAATFGTLYKTHERRPVYITQVGTPAPIIPMSTLDAPMMHSGSTLPSAAVQGTYVTGTTIGTYSPANAAGPNRVKKGDDDWEDDDPHEDEEPWTTPVGDAGWPLMMLALAYVCVRAFLRRKRA